MIFTCGAKGLMHLPAPGSWNDESGAMANTECAIGCLVQIQKQAKWHMMANGIKVRIAKLFPIMCNLVFDLYSVKCRGL